MTPVCFVTLGRDRRSHGGSPLPLLPNASDDRRHGVTPSRGAERMKVIETPSLIRRNGLMFDIPKQGEPLPEDKPVKAPKLKAEKIKRVCDPRLVAAARELRDRWLEEVNAGRYVIEAGGKYEVGRLMERREAPVEPMRLLAA